MTSLDSTTKSIMHRTAVAALAMLITMSTGTVALAQGASGQSQPMLFGEEEQDSLLPPEVVPLDPSAAGSSMNSNQKAVAPAPYAAPATTQRAQAPQQMGNTAAVPGLVGGVDPSQGTMQSAQDFRKAAFNSLYNQAPIQAPMQQQQQQPFSNGWGQAPQAGFSPNAGQVPYASPMAPGSNAMANNQPVQSQTLSGGTKYKQKLQDIRRGGFSNGLSVLSTFATGALMGGFFVRPNNPLLGAGVYGLSATGFGTRNGFRF
jgi:hypothetical protein